MNYLFIIITRDCNPLFASDYARLNLTKFIYP